MFSITPLPIPNWNLIPALFTQLTQDCDLYQSFEPQALFQHRYLLSTGTAGMEGNP